MSEQTYRRSIMSDLDPKDLTPGKLDGWAERAFTSGGCAALAIAIHDAKG